MAEIAVQPIVLKDMVLSLGTDDYAAAVSSATLTPAGGTTTWKGLKQEASFTFPQSSTWTLDLEYAQDWADATSLSRYLFDNAGETVAAILEPASGVGTRWTFDVIIVEGAVGGAVDTVGTASVSLGVSGRPVPSAIV